MQMGLNMKAIGKMINKMEMELNNGLMEHNIKEPMYRGRKKAMEFSDGLTVLTMMESF